MSRKSNYGIDLATTKEVEWTGGFDKIRTFCLSHGASRVDLVDEVVHIYLDEDHRTFNNLDGVIKLSYGCTVAVDENGMLYSRKA